MDTDNRGHFGFFQLRSIYDQLKQYYYGRTANNEFSETNVMLEMLLDGLDSDTVFFEPFKLDYGDVLRRTKLERGLCELELLGPNYSANGDNCDSDGFHSNSTKSVFNSQDDLRALVNKIHSMIDEFSVSESCLREYLARAKLWWPELPPEPYSPRQPSRDAAVAAHVRSTIRKEFGEEYHRVVNKIDLGEITKRFQNPARAWRCGVDTLRKISNGRLVRDLGCAIAMLCVCSAMSRTLDKNYPRNKFYDYKDSYFGHFKNDLYRWGLLYKNPSPCTPSSGISFMSCKENCGLHRFTSAVKTIWDVDTESRILEEHTIGCFDDDSVRYFKDLASKLVLDLDDILYPANASDDELEEARRPSVTQQIHPPRRLSLYGTASRHTWPHRLKNTYPVLAALVTGAIFLILFIFLTCESPHPLQTYFDMLNWSDLSTGLWALTAEPNAPDVLLGANLTLTRAECKSNSFLDRVRCAEQVLITFFERYPEVNHLDIAHPGLNQQGIVDTREVVPSHSPALYSTLTTQQCQAPEITQRLNQISTSDGVSTHGVKIKISCTEPGCSKTYTYPQGLNKHMRNAHKPKRKCKHCNQGYTRDGFKHHNCANKYEESSGPQSKRRKTPNAELDM